MGSDLAVWVDGTASSLEPLTEPNWPSRRAPVGCRPSASSVASRSMPAHHRWGKPTRSVTDRTDDDRIGWHEVSAGPAPGPRSWSPTFPRRVQCAPHRLPAVGAHRPARGSECDARFARNSAGTGSVVPVAGGAGGRSGDVDPLAALIGGALSPGVVALAVLLSLGLGAAHAGLSGPRQDARRCLRARLGRVRPTALQSGSGWPSRTRPGPRAGRRHARRERAPAAGARDRVAVARGRGSSSPGWDRAPRPPGAGAPRRDLSD